MRIISKLLDKYNFFPKYGIILSLLVFSVYLSTMSRSVNEFDSGELAATQALWGIPHPTSYPLFNLLGFLFSKFPLPLPTIVKLNLLPVIWNTLTIFVLFSTVSLVLSNIKFLSKHKSFSSLNNHYNPTKWEIVLISALSSLSFAFSVTFWIQATKIEVYALQILLTSIIFLLSLKIFIFLSKGYSYEEIGKYWNYIAIFLGLSFSNHLMTIYLLPALIFLLIFTNIPFSFKVKIFIRVMIISFTIATAFYLIMMFRAQSKPPYMFGEPYNISGLINTILGKDYSQFMFSGIDSVKKQSSKFLTVLSLNFNRSDFIGGEFSFNIIFIFAGLFISAIVLRQFFYFTFIIISTSLFFAFNYSIPDINEYFLVVFYLFSIFTAIIIYFILLFLSKKILRYFLLSIALTFTLSQFFFNYNSINRSSDYFTESYTKAVLNSLPENSILLTTDWDYIISPAIYLQKVEKFRNDIEIIIPTWLEKRWYKPEIKQKYSNIIEFLDNEYYISFDIIRDLILKEKFRIRENTNIIPDLLTFKVIKDKNYHPVEIKKFNIKFNKRISANERYYRNLICWILEERARYELKFNKFENVKLLDSIIKSIDPDYKLTL